jgi:hypothetical protein
MHYVASNSHDPIEEGLQDSIVAVCLQIQFLAYVYKRTWLGERPLVEKVASMDTEKSMLIKFVSVNLSKVRVGTETYLTMMLATFDKTMSKPPTVDSIVDKIKQAQVYDEQTPLSHTKVTDFDIDLFFVILQSIDKFSNETKFLLMSHYMLLQREHSDSFMKLVSGQANSGNNPFDSKLRHFFLKVANMHQHSPDPRLVTLAE